MAARFCFGQDEWPASVALPTATIGFKLSDHQAVHAAVEELKAKGQPMIHDAKIEPWEQLVARFLSHENTTREVELCPLAPAAFTRARDPAPPPVLS